MKNETAPADSDNTPMTTAAALGSMYKELCEHMPSDTAAKIVLAYAEQDAKDCVLAVRRG